MAVIDIGTGETVTVDAGESLDGGPMALDGTLNLDGTTNLGETPISGDALAGVTATGLLSDVPAAGIAGVVRAGTTATADTSAEFALIGSADAGATALGRLAGEKHITALANAGSLSTTALRGERNIVALANAGALTTGDVTGIVPLRRSTSFGIDNTRRDEFDTQGTGDVDD